MIQKAMLDPVQCPEEADTEDILKSRIECSSSLLHQADLILRKCVATKMAECEYLQCLFLYASVSLFLEIIVLMRLKWTDVYINIRN